MPEEEILDNQPKIDWTNVKVKSSKDGFEIHIPSQEAGREIIMEVAGKLMPHIKSSLEERMESPNLLEDWRLDGNQTTCQEGVETIDGKQVNVVYMFVKNDDKDAEEKLNSAIRSLLPEDFVVEQN